MPLLRSLVLQAARIVLALFLAFPIVFMLVSSLKPDQQIFSVLDSIKAFLPVGHPVPWTTTPGYSTGFPLPGS